MEKLLRRAAELSGKVGGAILAPLVAVGAALRRGRLFHPEGVCFAGRMEPSPAAGRFGELGGRVAGPAMVRLSPALWRGDRTWPDVLGCAVRLGLGDPWRSDASSGDQDLLFATIPRPYLTPLGMLFTDPHDFLANVYWAVSPFEVDGGPDRTYLRLVGLPGKRSVAPRAARLAAAVMAGGAGLRLEASSSPWHGYVPVAHLWLEAPLALDQRALRFWPFRAGRGLVPRGFVHALRPLAYAASQAARATVGERPATLRPAKPRVAEAPGAEPSTRAAAPRTRQGRPGAEPPRV